MIEGGKSVSEALFFSSIFNPIDEGGRGGQRRSRCSDKAWIGATGRLTSRSLDGGSPLVAVSVEVVDMLYYWNCGLGPKAMIHGSAV